MRHVGILTLLRPAARVQARATFSTQKLEMSIVTPGSVKYIHSHLHQQVSLDSVK